MKVWTPDDGPPRSKDVLDGIDHHLAQLEGILLVAILATMVIVATMQFVLRKTFDFGFEWADILVRQMVLWLGFIGGALATHQGRHIAIDAVLRVLSPRKRAVARAVAALVAAGTTTVMTRAAYIFVEDERATSTTLVGSVPGWVLLSIIPISLALITFHFLVAARHNVLVALGRRPASPDRPSKAAS